ncbi:dephospho-CoA kinase [Tenacibaculum sp. KUL118]|uniref:dephospho-CoA kinase n=1 Tax=Tenacibaculum mesophilum TaxID=104268 RepID=UPI0012E5DF14|nr:dephospho-CoA kinase [Tenacibaculum sp. KUL118]
MVIGLTGGIGSGKSTVINIFSEFENIAIYIADDEAKKLMNTSKRIKEQLITEFGEEVYINHKLNRPYLASIVFNNKKKLAILNAIVHPAVNKHLQQFLKKNSIKDYILYENAILFENGSDSFCDKIITVTAPEHIRIERVIKRDRTTIQEVKNRIKNQWSETKKILQSNYLINNISLLKTKDEVLKIHNYLTKSRK